MVDTICLRKLWSIEYTLSIINDFTEKFNLHMKLKKTQSYHSLMWKYVEKTNTHHIVDHKETMINISTGTHSPQIPGKERHRKELSISFLLLNYITCE